MTPDQRHFGQAEALFAARQATLDAAFRSTPERFVRQPPKPPQIPTAVWITPPCKNLKRPGLKSEGHCLKVVDTFRMDLVRYH